MCWIFIFFQKSVLLYGKSHWPSTQVGCTRYDAFPLSTNLLAQVLLVTQKPKYKGQKLKHFRYFWLENGCSLMKKGVLTWWWESKRTLQWQLGGCWHFLLLRCMRLSSSEDMRGGRTATTTSVHQCPRVPAYEEAWGSSKHRVVLVELRKPDFSSLPSFLKKSCPDNNLWLFMPDSFFA